MSKHSGMEDPFTAFNFEVGLDGVISGQTRFQQVSGITWEMNVEDFQEGGLNTHTRKIKGPAKYGNVTLKRGVLQSTDDVWQWVKANMNNTKGKPLRSNVSIIGYNDAMQTGQITITLKEAYPCKWEAPSWDTKSSAILMESLEIAHEGMDVKFSAAEQRQYT